VIYWFLLSFSLLLLCIGKAKSLRRVLFWFSSAGFPENTQLSSPDPDFQLNPWTLYSLVRGDFMATLVSVLFLSLKFFFGYLTLSCRKEPISFRAGGNTPLMPTFMMEHMRL
jgi:hypothetical protein